MAAQERLRVPAKRPWASVVGYSRAVRVGDVIEVAGTVAADGAGEVVAPGDPYAQTAYCLRVIGDALRDLGGSFQDVVRTRIFVRRIEDWEAIGRAHGEVFASVQPVSSVVGAGDLLHPDFLVEIEASAIVASGGDARS